MYISDKSYSPLPMRRSSDSMNEVVAKSQHVPVLAWFLTGVAFNSTSGVNL